MLVYPNYNKLQYVTILSINFRISIGTDNRMCNEEGEWCAIGLQCCPGLDCDFVSGLKRKCVRDDDRRRQIPEKKWQLDRVNISFT